MTEATPWVDGLTLGEMLSIRTVESADQEAFVFSQQSVRWTYANFNNQVLRAARALLALQVKPGEHIGVWATNWPQWLVMQFSSALVGAPLVNINPAYRGAELEYVLNNADISTLILIDRFKTSDYFAILESICPEVPESNGTNLNSARCPALKRIISMQESSREGYLGWDDFMQRSDLVTDSELEERRISRGADEIVNIQYTSGTTGFPKGVLLSHRNLLMNAFFVGQRMAITPLDRICIPVPFYHCFGCVMGNLVTVEYGATGVIPNEYFEPRATLQALSEEQCTAVYGVPAMFIAQRGLLGEKDYDLSSLRTGIMAGSPCPIEIMRQVANDMGASEITIAYGLTEASPVITQTHTHDDLELRVSTVGPPLPGIEVKIVSPETGEDLPEEKQGGTLGARPWGHAGLLQTPRRHGKGNRSGGLVTDRRSGHPAGEWLLSNYRPDQGYADPGRRKHLSPRDRGVSLHSSGDSRCSGGRVTRSETGRRSLGLDRCGARLGTNGGRGAGLLPGRSGSLQGAALCLLCGPLSFDRDRKDPQVQAARNRD